MKKHILLKLIAFAIYSAALTICLFTFGWKLALIIVLFLWGNNLEEISEIYKSKGI